VMDRSLVIWLATESLLHACCVPPVPETADV
jgi:hypothetical protein